MISYCIIPYIGLIGMLHRRLCHVRRGSIVHPRLKVPLLQLKLLSFGAPEELTGTAPVADLMNI